MSLCLAEMCRPFLEIMLWIDINSCFPLNGKRLFCPTSQRFNINKQTRLPIQVVFLLQCITVVTLCSYRPEGDVILNISLTPC